MFALLVVAQVSSGSATTAASAATSSLFWPRADALCSDVTKNSSPDPLKLGDADAAFRELVLYCAQKTPPRFAAKSEAERSAKLDAIYAVLGKPSFDQSIASAAADAQPDLLRAAEAEARRDSPPDLGFFGEKILGAGIGELCSKEEVRVVLPSVCKLASSKDEATLVALRVAVIRDLVDLLAAQVTKAASTSEVAAKMRLLAATLEHEDIRTYVDRLPEMTVPCTRTSAECSLEERATRMTATILARILRDGPKLDRTAEHYTNVVEEVARTETKRADLTLSNEARTLATSLVVALQTLDTNREAHKPVSEIARHVAFALGRAYVLGAYLSTTIDASVEQSEAARRVVESSARLAEAVLASIELVQKADALALFELIKPVLESVPPDARLTPTQLRAVRAAARFSMARTEGDLRTIGRDAVLPLPAWVDKLVFDLNLMPPQSKTIQGGSTFSLNSDVTVGYNGTHLGFFVHADTAYYELNALNNFALTERYNGNGDVWGVVDLNRNMRLDLRLSLGAAYYGTLADNSIGGGDRQTNQDSIFIRGSGLVGLRASVGSRVSLGIWAGAGGQYEDYYSVVQTSNGEQGTTFNAATGLRLDARLRFQWTLFPSILSLRARADFDQFSMRRNDQALTRALGTVTQDSQGVVGINQTELFARGFLDVDALGFFGFVPAVHGGVNAFFLSNNGQAASSVIPVVGVGIRREAL